ncbi:uncharacterized protein HKW66_Vig0188240 [Vigna angularis]|uniref:Uncharacterized protein n=1 Tax=Phaseolus angularis TaxID=3914 RepID=A0A8T0KUC8_PHAAN|nr:uncharacterized protein HKW66_Vig0188240 [Vigna angularis]
MCKIKSYKVGLKSPKAKMGEYDCMRWVSLESFWKEHHLTLLMLLAKVVPVQGHPELIKQLQTFVTELCRLRHGEMCLDMDPTKTPTAIHMTHSSSSVDADLICLEITRVVNKLADFLAIEALIIVFDVYTCIIHFPPT